MTIDQILADHRMMKRFVGDRIPPDTITRIVMADGPDGPAWVDITALWDDEGDCDLIVESNEPDAFGLRDAYEYFRRKELTAWEQERERASEVNRWRVHDLERENAVLREAGLREEVGQAASEEQGGIDCAVTVDESGLPREVSTAEAAKILGISKDTVLKLKSAACLNIETPAHRIVVVPFLPLRFDP